MGCRSESKQQSPKGRRLLSRLDLGQPGRLIGSRGYPGAWLVRVLADRLPAVKRTLVRRAWGWLMWQRRMECRTEFWLAGQAPCSFLLVDFLLPTLGIPCILCMLYIFSLNLPGGGQC